MTNQAHVPCGHELAFHAKVGLAKELSARNHDGLALEKAAYARYYDTPEHLRADLPPYVVEGMERLEGAGRELARAREDAVHGLLEAVVGKMADLGAARAGTIEAPAWAGLLADLETLRDWRRVRLDGIDSRMDALFLRGWVDRPRGRGMFDEAVLAWCHGVGVRPREVQQAILQLAGCGFLPAIVDPAYLDARTLDRTLAVLQEVIPDPRSEIEAAMELIPTQIDAAPLALMDPAALPIPRA